MRFVLSVLVLFSAAFAHADFGEVDLIVRESIENDFRDYGRRVDLSRLEYDGQRVNGNILTVESTVWGQEGHRRGWGWHRCTTKLEILAPGRYRDQGTSCYFDAE